MKKIAAVIPSRYQSTRFEGKPLALIGGIPMIERVYRQVEKAGCFSPGQIIVATDDSRIETVVKNFGGCAVMTSPTHQSGSERLWEVMEKSDFDALINIQGDEPIVSSSLIKELYSELQTGRFEVITPAFHNLSYEDYLSPHNVKVVLDDASNALYFSRAPIPFMDRTQFNGFYHHMGIYAYTRDALRRFVHFPKSKLESIEKLEQLRFLENQININVVLTSYRSIGVDVPEDVQRVEKLLKEMNDHD